MSITTAVTTATLQVPGARLYYEVRGSGPVLLLMPGGPMDAGGFRDAAGILARHRTVVTYDPRGLSRSKLEGPLDAEHIIEVFADDVHRLLASLTNDKADVFGSSGGATIALELAARHPEQIGTVVPHEPPSPALQPNPAEVRAAVEDTVETYRTAGPGPAFAKFAAVTRSGPAPESQGEPAPDVGEDMDRIQGNLDIFMGPYMLAIARYEPDIAALKKASCRIVPGVGEESRGELAHDGGLGLAKELGMEAVKFPGGHGGFGSHPVEFSKRLEEVLAG